RDTAATRKTTVASPGRTIGSRKTRRRVPRACSRPPPRGASRLGKRRESPVQPSGQAHEPAVLVLGPSVLGVEQSLAQLHGLLSGVLTVIDGEVLAHELADRRDHRGRTAGEGLDDLTAGRTLAPFLDGDPALLGLESELRRQLEQRTTGDAVEDRVTESRR